MSTLATRPHRRFNAEKFTFELWRLWDQECRQLWAQSFPIQIDSPVLMQLLMEQGHSPDALNLPQALLILESKFGKSSADIDTWKQSFSFPFLLAIIKPSQTFYYLLRIEDYRGRLDFRFYRIVDHPKYADKRLDVYHSPIADEFSADDIDYVIGYCWGFMEGSASHLYSEQAEIQPFFRHIDSNHVIYGYWDGKFVEEVIADSDEYQSRVRILKAQYGKPTISETEAVTPIQSLIQAIITS